jgi:hypothetical protein
MAPASSKKTTPGLAGVAKRFRKSNLLRQPGDHTGLLQQQTHGFASPAFAGFASIGREVKELSYSFVIGSVRKNFISQAIFYIKHTQSCVKCL